MRSEAFCEEVLESYVKESKRILVSDNDFKYDLEEHIALYCQKNGYLDLVDGNRVSGDLECALNVACNTGRIFHREGRILFFDYEKAYGWGVNYYLKEVKNE